jgi:hypothetical protein
MARHTKGTDDYRKPLAEGNPRRLIDAKCAWRGMSPEQKVEFMAWRRKFEKGAAK